NTSELLKGIRSGSADERWAAARAAADIPSAVTALAAALPTETDPRVREAMFTSLVRIGTAQSMAEVIPLLRSNDAALRTGALDPLRSSVATMPAWLPRLLDDPDVDVRILSCELARGLPDDEATLLLCSLLAREEQINVCAAAIEVLAEVGNQ